jgi:hypothetical protein
MLTHNDKTRMCKGNLKISKCTRGEHSSTVMKCEVFQKMNMNLKHNFS